MLYSNYNKPRKGGVMANDNDPNKNVEAQHIEIKAKKVKATDIPVSVEFTKRRQLDAVLDILEGFTPREVWRIVRIYMRKRRTERLKQQNTATVQQILKR